MLLALSSYPGILETSSLLFLSHLIPFIFFSPLTSLEINEQIEVRAEPSHAVKYHFDLLSSPEASLMLPDNHLARCSTVIKSLMLIVCLSKHPNESHAATYFRAS